MTRNISAENLAALAARRLVARDFLTIVARTRDTGAPVEDNMWSDVGNVTASVVNPDTGLEDSRDFYGSGTLVAISDIPLVANLSVQNATIQMSQVNDRVEQLVRDYDCQQARVEIFRGLFNPDTRQMVAPAECRFVGFVDTIEITTPSENEEGAVTLTCASHTQEMTRSNPDWRCHRCDWRRDRRCLCMDWRTQCGRPVRPANGRWYRPEPAGAGHRRQAEDADPVDQWHASGGRRRSALLYCRPLHDRRLA